MRSRPRTNWLLDGIRLRGFCRVCKRHTNTGWHHIIPRSEGGTNEPRNLLESCILCHDDIEFLEWKDYPLVRKKNRRRRTVKDKRGIWGVDEYGTVYCILFRDEDPDQEMLELRRTISSHARMEEVLFDKMSGRKMEQNTSSAETFSSGRQVYWGGIKFRECQCVVCTDKPTGLSNEPKRS